MSVLEFIVSITGLSFGSFIGACAYRIPRGISVITTRSFCSSCRAVLQWYEIIPLVGFIISQGKCRHCGARIPAADLLVELSAGVLVLLLFLRFGVSIEFMVYTCFVLLMLLVASIDWHHLVIPNRVLLAGFALGFLIQLAGWRTDVLLDSLKGAAGAGILLLVVMLIGNLAFRKDTMGGGDIKLATLVGFYIGFQGFLVSLWIAAATGALFGLGRARAPGRGLDEKIPFGSFLAAASILYVIFQVQFQEWIQQCLTYALW